MLCSSFKPRPTLRTVNRLQWELRQGIGISGTDEDNWGGVEGRSLFLPIFALIFSQTAQQQLFCRIRQLSQTPFVHIFGRDLLPTVNFAFDKNLLHLRFWP